MLLILSFVYCVFGFRKQGVGVKGKLLCDGKPLHNAKVKIFDVDRNPGDSDDLLDEKYTDINGEFVLDGTTRELTNIEPELRIFHDCNDDIRPCQRKLVVKIPGDYIHSGTAEKWFHFQKDLFERKLDEDRSCHQT
uniref:Transthyretin-like protein 46 n=1 Tax=Acrobeloides nanus TaxID=290746 RepID=A0A914E0Q5_9BILA